MFPPSISYESSTIHMHADYNLVDRDVSDYEDETRDDRRCCHDRLLLWSVSSRRDIADDSANVAVSFATSVSPYG